MSNYDNDASARLQPSTIHTLGVWLLILSILGGVILLLVALARLATHMGYDEVELTGFIIGVLCIFGGLMSYYIFAAIAKHLYQQERILAKMDALLGQPPLAGEAKKYKYIEE